MNSLHLSKYTISIVVIYLFISIYFFFFTKRASSLFVFSGKDFLLLPPILLCALVSLFLVNKLLRFGDVSFNRKSLSQVLLIIFYYGLLIALPEELIFRGFVQQNLHSYLGGGMAIILSAAIFGFAHVFNGARSLEGKDWNWKLVAMSFVAGLFLGFAYFLTGSLIVPIVLHILLGLVMKIFIK